MERLLLPFLFLTFTACQHRKSLTFEELCCPDYVQRAIKQNGIDSVITVSQNSFYDIKKGERIGELMYDSSGRILFDGTDRFSDFRFEYDSTGILKRINWRDWDIHIYYDVSYRYVPDSLMFFRFVIDEDSVHQYKEAFSFNEKGQLIEREIFTFKGMDRGIWGSDQDEFDSYFQSKGENLRFGIIEVDTTFLASRLTKYVYNDDGTLKKEEQWERKSDNTQRKMERTYFYSSHLDSVLTDFQWYGYRNWTYYDASGLKQKIVYNDTLALTYEYFKWSR